MEKENITYRVLKRDEIINKLDEIDSYEIIEETYYFKDGKLVLEKEHREFKHFDSWHERFEDLTEDYDNGYTLLGAFDGEKLVGLVGMRGDLIGENNDTINLSTCFISKNYRKQGIATKLIDMLKERARRLNAKKMYVSAAPSKNTVHFYMGIGFQVTNEPIKEIFDENPKDIQMEFIL